MLKGGTGKTTSAWFIALYYAVVLGLPTLLLDADPTSQSAYDWCHPGRRLRDVGRREAGHARCLM
jgi:cellulose biosynthesis protein BcsQ